MYSLFEHYVLLWKFCGFDYHVCLLNIYLFVVCFI